MAFTVVVGWDATRFYFHVWGWPDLRVADYAWIALGVGVAVYELVAPDSELLSAGWDRYLKRSPVLARVLPLVLCLHVVNLLPRRVDPVAGLFVLVRIVKGIF